MISIACVFLASMGVVDCQSFGFSFGTCPALERPRERGGQVHSVGGILEIIGSLVFFLV